MMSNGLIQTAARSDAPVERRIYGVAVAQVVNNIDLDMLGRVQVHLPWLPEVEPWARVAVPMTGKERGTYFIPQKDDEVLIAFNHGDIRDPYIIGSLWNSQDPPPIQKPTDAITKRIIRTEQGHEIEFDDARESIKIISSKEHLITIEPEAIKIAMADNKASVTLTKEGKITIKAFDSLKLEAQSIEIKGNQVTVKGNKAVKVQGGQICEIKASTVKIN